MNLYASLFAALLLATTGSALAGHKGKPPGHIVTVPVDHVEPIYRVVETRAPRQDCRYETYSRSGSRYQSHTPMILGAVLGGVAAREIANDHDDMAGIAGALLGGSIGRDIGRYTQRPGDYQTGGRVCTEVHDVQHREEITGYRVTYRYDGRSYTTRMDHDPGHIMDLKVRVEPIRGRGHYRTTY